MTVALKVQFTFTNNTIGLPDHTYIETKNNRPLEGILRKSLHMLDRRHGKACLARIKKEVDIPVTTKLTMGKYPLIDNYADPSIRRLMYIKNHLLHSEKFNDEEKLNLSLDAIPSWELITFYTYAPEFFSDTDTYKSFHYPVVPELLGKMKGLSEKAQDALMIASAVADKLVRELEAGKATDDARKQLLVDTIVSCSTIVDSKIFNNATTLMPGLLDMCSLMVSMECNQQAITNEGSDKSSTAITDYENETDFLDAIEAQVLKCRSETDDIEKAKELSLLTDSYVTWIETHPRIELVEQFLMWVTTLFSIGVSADLPLYSEDDEGGVIWSIFQKVWIQYFKSEKGRNPKSNDLIEQFNKILENIRGCSVSLYEVETDLESAQNELSKLKASPSSNTIQARRKYERTLTDLELKVTSKRARLHEIQDDATLLLLPSDSTMDVFDQEMMGVEFNVDMEFASADLKKSFLLFFNWVGEQGADFKVESFDKKSSLTADQYLKNETDNIEPINTENKKQKSGNDNGFKDEINPIDCNLPESEILKVVEKPSITIESPDSEELKVVDSESLVHQLKSSVVSIDVKNTGLTEEYLNCCKLALDCKIALDRDVFISGALVNEVLSTFVINGQLEMAVEFSYTVSKNNISSNFLPYHLFKAAYYGMETYNERAGFNKSRRLLNEIKTGELEAWTSQSNSEIATFLLFAACFQPAIFGGNTSSAITLLRDISTAFFDKNTQALIKETIELANSNETVTLKSLKVGGKLNSDSEGFNITSLDAWSQKIRQSRQGFAPLLKALSYCLEQGLFKEIETIIRSNEKQKISIVIQFVNQYDSVEASTILLNEILPLINYHIGEGITRLGRQRFHHKVSELVEIASDWLADVQHAQSSNAEQYSKRFLTRLQTTITYFSGLANEGKSALSRRAGAFLVTEQLKRLQASVLAGERHWTYERAKYWYYHPQMLMHIDNVIDEPIPRLNWQLLNLDKTLDVQKALKKAIELQNIQLAELLRLNLIESGEQDVLDIQEHFLAYKTELMTRCNRLDGQLENALLSGLIDAPQAEIYTSGLGDMLDAIDQLQAIDSTVEIHRYLNELGDKLRKLTASTKIELERRYDSLITLLNSSVGEAAAPNIWRTDIHNAFEVDNLPIVNEMLDELERAVEEKIPIQLAATYEVKNVQVLNEFIKVEKNIINGLKEVNNRSEQWQRVSEGGKSYGLSYEKKPPRLHRVMETLELWRNSGKPKASIDKDVYDKIVNLLEIIGINVRKPHYQGTMKAALNYQTAIGFSSIVLQIKPSPSTRPFTMFGDSLGEHNLQVIVAYKSWTTEQLKEVLDSHHIHDEAVLICAVPLTQTQRYKFARFCKKRRKTLLHFDLSMALFLAAQQHDGAENIAIRNFMWLSIPYTYFNPYSGTDASKPPLREMRYGRELQIDSLLKMNNGSAIVFGGRQLGKSTIMQEVRARFHLPKIRQYAFYEMLDKDLLGRTNVSREDLKMAETKIWDYLYSWLKQFRLIKNAAQNRNIDTTKDAVKQALIDNKDVRIIAIFDEIDPILHVDSAHDFSIFRGIRNLIQIPEINGRFKVIIGGLANVKRFENSPNYPLTQLGGSIQVSIMPAQEALHLIIEPLRAAGYRFENAQVANRILATTNRHPGLIQIFCHELINYLSVNKTNEVGKCVICDEDVVNVSRNNQVIELIRNRFDMTLNLDKRYQVIIYSVIDDGRGSQPFSIHYAKDLAECWLPSAFSQLSDKQFESFLVELTGLGVLRQLSDGRYALRNTNVLKLLTNSNSKDVTYQLERAIEDYNSYDPLDRHAFDPDKHGVPMPITCRDEKSVLGTIDNTVELSPLQILDMRKLTTTIIGGSEALGLHQLKNTLPSLFKEELMSRKNGHGGIYTTHEVSTTQYSDPSVFNKKLLIPLMQHAKTKPQMVFITIDESTSLANLLGMLDATHLLNEQQAELPYPVRIIFLMGPSAYWKWLCSPDLTQDREALQPFIKLGPWATDAIRALMERLGMNDSTNATNQVAEITEGWYFSLEILVSMSRSHPDWKELSQFRTNFTPLIELKKHGAEKFLRKTGLLDHTEALKILIEIHKEYGINPFDQEIIELFAEEADVAKIGSDKAHALGRWLSNMNLLSHTRSKSGGEKQYVVKAAVNHALNVWVTDE